MPEEKKEKSIRLPMEGARKRAWEDMLQRKKIGQQDALYALIDWIVQQDGLVQSMVLRQVEAEADLVRQVLTRMAGLEKAVSVEAAEELTLDETRAAVHTLVDRLHREARAMGNLLKEKRR